MASSVVGKRTDHLYTSNKPSMQPPAFLLPFSRDFVDASDEMAWTTPQEALLPAVYTYRPSGQGQMVPH